MDARPLWQATLGQLQLQLSKPTYDTWVKNTEGLSYEDGVLVVGVHSAYAQDWLENRLYAVIQRTATQIANRTTSVRFIVRRNDALEQGGSVELLVSQPIGPNSGSSSGDGEYTRTNPSTPLRTLSSASPTVWPMPLVLLWPRTRG